MRKLWQKPEPTQEEKDKETEAFRKAIDEMHEREGFYVKTKFLLFPMTARTKIAMDSPEETRWLEKATYCYRVWLAYGGGGWCKSEAFWVDSKSDLGNIKYKTIK